MAENIPWVLHSDWMTTIKYLSHSNSLITTSMDGNLLMLDFEKRHLKWSGKEHAHGIYSCDYCRSSLSTTTSCSLDFMTSIDLQNASLKLFFYYCCIFPNLNHHRVVGFRKVWELSVCSWNCRSYNFIVTCGLERYINIWNPFTAKTMGVLHGHEASVFVSIFFHFCEKRT